MKTDSTNACPKCGATVPADAPQGLCPRCVLAAASAPEPAPTATSQIPSLERLAVAFPQLQIIELIGRGGMGFVFKARQPHLDRFVALKLLPDSLAHDPQFAERFNREGRVLARLNHPNIVSIFDFGHTDPRPAALQSRSSDDLAGRVGNSPASSASAAAAALESRAPSESGFYYLMMEYVDGVNLRQAMQAGRFSPAEALAIVPKICEALQFAHEEGILHRDIKPENILLDAKGRVKIADFGIAKLVGEEHPDVSLTATGAALGTMHYMAPEQIEKPATVDHRADIYSLGVVFYELLTGELPLGRFGPPSAKTPVDSRVDDVVMRTLEKEREKRFQSAGEMGTTVEHLTEVGAGSFKAAPPKVPGAEPQRGPGGTTVINPTAVISPAPAWSLKAIVSAALVGLSLLLPLLSLAVLLLKPYRYEEAPAVISFLYKFTTISLLSSIPAFVGTILGWMALSDVSVSGGRLRGAVFAVFAALAWPVLLLSGVTVWLVVAPIRNFSGSVPFASFLLMLVPAGLVTFIVWAIYTTTRKATGQPAPQRRGALKWVFLGLFLALVGFGITSRSNRTSAEADGPFAPLSAAEMLPANMVELVAITRHPSDGAWWNADGAPSEQHVTQRGANATPINGQHAVEFFFRFQNMDLSGTAVTYQFGLCSVSADGAVEENGQPVRDGAIVAATFPDSLRATTVRVGLGIDPWETLATSRKNADSQISFSRKGRPIKVGFVAPVERSPSFTVLTVTHSLEGEAVRAIAVDAAGREHLATETETSRLNEEFSATFPLARRDIREFRFQARPYRWAEFRNVPLQPLERRPSGAVSATATNITPWIRFTFTAVELREVQGVRWLAIDYLDDVHGDCQKSFPWETTILDFKGETRTAAFVSGDTNLPVRHQRVEYRMQESRSRAELEDLRDRAAEKLNHKSFRLNLGEELLLFELPTPGAGAFQARIKVVLPLKVGEQIEPGANPLALQFRLVALDADTNALVDVMMESQGDRPARRLRVLRPVLMDGSAVARAGIQLETNGTRTIGIELTAEGARQFGSITASNIDRQLVIAAGRRVLSAPIIKSPIHGGELQISGAMPTAEVHKLVAELNRKPAGLEFSPAVERSLPPPPEIPSGAVCFDFESGMMTTNRTFRDNQRATRDWLQMSGADLLGLGTQGPAALIIAYDLASIEASATAWDSMSPSEVGWNWALMRDAAKQESQLGTAPGLPNTFLFRTRENTFGILQILSATNSAPDVKIRYKLVKDALAK